jgi:membrane-associated phospholipid phosphatase
MRWFLWSFAIANVISFVTWIALPAAPPWYIHAHGCSIDMTTLPSPAGLARVDRLLGIEYFSGFYSRAASVFGALPSMHCAYPMLGLLTAWKHEPRPALVLHVLYAAWMALAAVYLGHHWVLDVLAGWATALAGVVLARKLLQAPGAAVPVVAAANATRGVVGG